MNKHEHKNTNYFYCDVVGCNNSYYTRTHYCFTTIDLTPQNYIPIETKVIHIKISGKGDNEVISKINKTGFRTKIYCICAYVLLQL